jgi:phosphoribosylaminoimidazolecarboxamide formyltransferase/IMP cyclohydrolase
LIKRAFITVYDKNGLAEFAQGLEGLGVEIISTGGTADILRRAGVEVRNLEELTDWPSILGGRVKSLHPIIYAGILANRSENGHLQELKERGIKPIDMIVCNFYPFREISQKPQVSLDEILESIDIGGPSAVRAAAKNHRWVAVLTNPAQYGKVLSELRSQKGKLSPETRLKLAQEAFGLTQEYDRLIYRYLEGDSSSFLDLHFQKVGDLRYGENPHQSASFYLDPTFEGTSLATSQKLSGKPLSFNNLRDLDAALGIIMDFEEPFAAIFKHANPCGAACSSSLAQAYQDALECDPLSAYGSIIGLNRKVDLRTAQLIDQTKFVECVLAPEYDPEALKVLRQKKSRRFLRCGELKRGPTREMRFIRGGLLLQDEDISSLSEADLEVVTKRKPTPEEIESLLFAFQVVKHVKSNGIVLVQDKRTVGIGAGQPSRVDSVIISVRKAGERARGSVLASDAFFPMRDGVEEGAKAGVKAIIQPGGSKRDPEVIAAADELGLAMVFTGVRHFRH